MAERQTPAQRLLGDFAPKMVQLTDDVLFGDIWKHPGLSPRDRSLVTVAGPDRTATDRVVQAGTISCRQAREQLPVRRDPGHIADMENGRVIKPNLRMTDD